MASMAPIPGPDVEKAPSLEAAAAVKKRKKKSEKGVYRPKIQIDVVFKQSMQAAATPKKRYLLKKKAGKEGLALGGEDSVVVGVAEGQVDGTGMEGVVLAGQRSVLLPEIGVGVGGRKVEGGGVEVEKTVDDGGGVEVEKKVGEEGGVEGEKVGEVGMEEDGTPPPKPLAMERRLPTTYLRRSGLYAKKCLDFGSGKSVDQVLPVAVGDVIAVVEARVGEVIVEEEKEATVAFTRKPRTKRPGSVKLNLANPGEWSSLLSKNKIFFSKNGGSGNGSKIISKSGGRGSGKAVRASSPFQCP